MSLPKKPRRFYLLRKEDVTGVSGPGVTCEGVQFTNGTVAFRWLSDAPSLTTFFGKNGLAEMLDKHGHKGKTEVIWLDPDDEGNINGTEDAEEATDHRSRSGRNPVGV
jgi:hypothetical protein